MIKNRPAPPGSRNWIDLLPVRDDKTVLRNPHKGWYWHYIDNGCGRPAYRDPAIHAPGDYVKDFPGLNHLYLRIDWCDIEAEKGVFDWSYIDSIMDEWGAQDYRFSFRVCCHEGGTDIPYATPKWVRDMGCGGTDVPVQNGEGTSWEPDYGDPIFLERLEVFVQQYGEKLDGHPAVEYVDLGSYGVWGEGHTYSNGTGRNWPIPVLKRHADIHARYFRRTPILMNDDLVSIRHAGTEQENWDLLNHCRSLGFGGRDDSVCIPVVSERNHYDSLEAPWMLRLLSENAPVDLELGHYQNLSEEYIREGFPWLDAMEKTRATYAGFHGYPRPWLERYPHFTERAANRLGYWYLLEGIDLPRTATANTPVCLDIDWLNAGFAPAYNRFGLRLRFENASTGAVYDQNLPDIDNRRWQPGVVSRERVKANLPDLPAGEWKVKVKMYEDLGDGERLIKLAIKEERVDDDGHVELASIEIV